MMPPIAFCGPPVRRSSPIKAGGYTVDESRCRREELTACRYGDEPKYGHLHGRMSSTPKVRLRVQQGSEQKRVVDNEIDELTSEL